MIFIWSTNTEKCVVFEQKFIGHLYSLPGFSENKHLNCNYQLLQRVEQRRHSFPTLWGLNVIHKKTSRKWQIFTYFWLSPLPAPYFRPRSAGLDHVYCIPNCKHNLHRVITYNGLTVELLVQMYIRLHSLIKPFSENTDFLANNFLIISSIISYDEGYQLAITV